MGQKQGGGLGCGAREREMSWERTQRLVRGFHRAALGAWSLLVLYREGTECFMQERDVGGYNQKIHLAAVESKDQRDECDGDGDLLAGHMRVKWSVQSYLLSSELPGSMGRVDVEYEGRTRGGCCVLT